MTTAELRIGNWIIEPGHNPFQIWGIYHEEGNDKINNLPITYFQPIPLTEEWYKRFENIDGTFNYVYSGKSLKVFNNGICIRVIRYVHDYQNFYYAISGFELITKRVIINSDNEEIDITRIGD